MPASRIQIKEIANFVQGEKTKTCRCTITALNKSSAQMTSRKFNPIVTHQTNHSMDYFFESPLCKLFNAILSH